jgi:hypothetical protein
MNQQRKEKKRIDYVKPEILDLGAVTPTIGGGTCIGGGGFQFGTCITGPTPKGETCFTGTGVAT